ncbi:MULTISPECIES: hypothetical protein [unclassified Rathayibacter]|uniref:hypothetical protein n=1 Tax=unclassified Rathayibacter TaxID=2609250 RepID=UPI0006F95E50|nr:MULTISPECIES: hypothetical protein [unclassified Rathayibacter]KQQ03948.1 hypothetical protein ASF42_10890 [Rathayibacter sp. Leaf294]KQS12402.1 hypothetical protein ASG06_10890 [Rathayibacter sp. Leaf185]
MADSTQPPFSFDEVPPPKRPSRRAVILGAVGAGLGVAALGGAGYAAYQAFRPDDVPGVPGDEGAPPQEVVLLPGVPEPVQSFGPNGTHWPSLTPWITGDVDTEVEVECTWAAIAEAITTALTTAGPSDTIRILVAPGELAGGGAGASSTPVMQDVGSLDRENRVLVYPRDGYGTVTTANSWRMLRVNGVTVAGIVTTGGFLVSGCSGSAFARIRVDAAYNVHGADGVEYTENVEVVEVVVPEAQLRDEDVTSLRTPTKGDGSLRYVRRVACYTAPGYKAKDSNAHTDTIQMSGQGDNYYGDFTSVDCIDFASTNTAFQIGSAPNVRYEHCLVVGGDVVHRVFPLPDGADPGGNFAASNGPGADKGCSAVDSIFIGAIGASSWAEVTDSTVGYEGTSAPTEGEWTIDPSILEWSADDVHERSPQVTDEYLATIWA